MMVTATNDKIETLKARVVKGIGYCNDLWQKAKQMADDPEQYEKIMQQLVYYSQRLRELIEMLRLLDYSECIFGQCKWDDENLVCFGCTKGS